MIFWYKAPEPGVSRTVPVITHHEKIIHLKGIGSGNLTIDVDLIASHLQIILFISFDDPPVEGEVLGIDLYGFTLFRYGQGAVEFQIPGVLLIVWENITVILTIGVKIPCFHTHDSGKRSEFLSCLAVNGEGIVLLKPVE